MADGSVKALATTRVEFGYIPVAEANLFSVVAGVPAHWAAEEADCLEHVVRKMLIEAVGKEGMDADTAYACRFLLDASCALREAS